VSMTHINLSRLRGPPMIKDCLNSEKKSDELQKINCDMRID